MSEPPQPPEDLPPPPAAQPTDAWALAPGAIVPSRAVPASSTPSLEPKRRRGRTALLAIVGVVVVLGAAGGATAYLFLRGSSADLLERVPADVDAVAVAYLDPSAGQKLNVARIADAFPGIGGTDGFGQRLEEWGDDALAGVDLRFDDVTAWVGVEVAVAADVVDGTPEVAILADVADRDGAERMFAKLQAPGAPWEDVAWTEREYLGTTLSIPEDLEGDAPSYAFDDDVLILASDPDMVERVIDTHRGSMQSIATAASFQDAESELPDGRLMLAFVDTASLQDEIEQAVAAEAVTAVGGLGDLSAVKGIGLSVSAESDGIALDVVASYDAASLTGALRERVMAPDRANTVLGSVPQDAWGVMAAQHLDISLEEAVGAIESQDPSVAADLRDVGLTGTGGVLDVLAGDMALAVAPDATTSVGGALLLSVDDAGAARAAVERFATGATDLLSADAGAASDLRWETRTHADGSTITFAPDSSVAYAVRDDVLVVGTSVEQVEGVLDARTDGSLVDDPAYLRGIGGVPTADGLFYVDVSRVVSSIRDALPPEDRDDFDEGIGPDLRTIRSVAFGVDMNETRQRFRMFVAIPPDDELTS
jgi:hypothetical protein